MDLEGKIMMKSPYEVQLSPNGNGALFEAINNNAIIKNHIKRVKYVQVIGVDNVLNKILDPTHIGFTELHNFDASLKCCVKSSPDEKVGVVLKKNGKYDIVEYSEISQEMAAQQTKDKDGNDKLVYELGSILMFMLSSKKLLNLCQDTASLNKLYHVAFKKIEQYDPEQEKAVKPDKENGYKFELFLHNFLPFCDDGKFGALKVQREDEFAPVKNANGAATDTPDIAKKLIYGQHRKWIESMSQSALKDELLKNEELEMNIIQVYQGENVQEFMSEHAKRSPLYNFKL